MERVNKGPNWIRPAPCVDLSALGGGGVERAKAIADRIRAASVRWPSLGSTTHWLSMCECVMLCCVQADITLISASCLLLSIIAIT